MIPTMTPAMPPAMTPASLSIKRPIFISCLVILMVSLGYLSLKKLPVDLFPDVTLPTVLVFTAYPGAGPAEVESEISKILEFEISSVSGIQKISSTNREGMSVVKAEFSLKMDIKYAEQQIRAKVQNSLKQLPEDILQPEIRTISPTDSPILSVALSSDLPPGDLFDLADELIRPQFEQVNQVGKVEILGGRKREVHIYLDRNRLKHAEISAQQVAASLRQSGRNIPSGKTEQDGLERTYRTMGEYADLNKIKDTVLRFTDIDNPVTIGTVGKVVDTLEDEKSRTYYDGKAALILRIYRQSGANSIEVADQVKIRMEKLNQQLKSKSGNSQLMVVNDFSRIIRANVEDVYESILLGILLTVIVVYFFLGSFRSTLITGLALPNSLLGAFIIMSFFGFSINIMSMLALSLVVGLLVDDAIVVRENIYRKIEQGMKPFAAALEGTNEVTLAVIATTLTILAVFGPIGNLEGIVGQYFKQFGLTVCFAMLVSLFDALTVAPMLSAYFAGATHSSGPSSSESSHSLKSSRKKSFFSFHFAYSMIKSILSILIKPIRFCNHKLLMGFDRFQCFLELIYEKTLSYTLRMPFLILVLGVLLFVGSLRLAKLVPVTFMPPQDNGEFYVNFELPPGTNLETMNRAADEVESSIFAYAPGSEKIENETGEGERQNESEKQNEAEKKKEKEKKKIVEHILKTIGNADGQANVASFYVRLVPRKQRTENTSQIKEQIRKKLAPFSHLNIKISDGDASGQNQRSFNMNITGNDLDSIKKVSDELLARFKKNPSLKDVDTSYREGKPETHVILFPEKSKQTGVSLTDLGSELRTQVEGLKTAIYRDSQRNQGTDYDIRVRMLPEQRDLKNNFSSIFVPNVNRQLIPLSKIASLEEKTGPSTILRENRSRYIQISADITPTKDGGKGLGGVMKEVKELMTKELQLPLGVTYSFVGQAERFAELMTNLAVSLGLGLLFIYLVLASLYESFITPFTIMLAIPLAISGAFAALFLTRTSLDLFSMIGCIMLMGLATKNSILLLDYTQQLMKEGKSRKDAVLLAGKTRLRPILMTSFAMIAGMMPLAIGLNEASKQRVSLGIGVVGGTISSTLLSLYIIPAAFLYIDRFQTWFYAWFNKHIRS